jgi:signal transduction histidine kinase
MDVPRKSNTLLKSDGDKFTRLIRFNPASSIISRWQLVQFLVQHRFLFVLLVTAFVILIKVLDVYIIRQTTENIYFWLDGLFYSVFTVGVAWGLLSLLRTTVSEREQVDLNSSMQATFSQKLGNARTWDEIIQQIVEYTHQVAARADFTLYVINPNSLHMEAEAACTKNGKIMLKPGSPANLEIIEDQDQLNHYRLPVTRNDLQVGVIQLHYPAGQTPEPAEINSLLSAAPVMGLALEGALLQSMAVEQAAVSENQRQQIAQNLHDTLAQNISYLRLKLDQLTGDNAVQEIGIVLKELGRMRASAEEAYQQVRNTLDELNPVHTDDLPSVIISQARVISARSTFNLNTSQIGISFPLASYTRQQILYVAREALHNIDKHAQASQVHLQFIWLENEFIMKITDDGVGFDPVCTAGNGHYGLWIMQHRANDIRGKLTIAPIEKQGTEITLSVPREPSAGM